MIRKRKNARTRGLDDARTRGLETSNSRVLEFSNPRVLQSSPPNSGNGFTLTEISIVLVVIAMLLGGVLVGKDLIRSAEIRALISEVNNYKKATEIFRTKYGSLPGDMYNATTYWGTASSGCSGAASFALGATAFSGGTCNGDGDGLVEKGTAGTTAEIATLWQQLALSGIIEGKYSGTATSYGYRNCTIGTTCPASKMKPVGIALDSSFSGYVSSNTYVWDANYSNAFYVGASPTWDVSLEGAAFIPSDAWSIDVKTDDGLPANGRVLSWRNTVTASCLTTDVATTAAYNNTDLTVRCALIFLNK